MVDSTSVLVANLIEAFKQVNQYLALGLVTSISALAIDRGRRLSQHESISPTPQHEAFSPFQGFPPMPRDAATLLLLDISFVAGLMGSYTAESAAGIVNRL